MLLYGISTEGGDDGGADLVALATVSRRGGLLFARFGCAGNKLHPALGPARRARRSQPFGYFILPDAVRMHEAGTELRESGRKGAVVRPYR